MKNLLLLFAVVLLFTACKDSDKQTSSEQKDKKAVSPAYTITKDGIGDLKIGMLQSDIEKLLKQSLVMKHAKDTGDIWSDTATVTYNKMEITLYFQKSYVEEHTEEMELFGLSTSSPLCKTSTGLGVGDDRNAILAAYEDNPINMGPESIMLNDTTWGFSKTNYYITVSDEKWDRQLSFILVNKKVASIEAILQMGD
ncbi:MAG TPA: hypothetical protein VMZ03_09790 [Chitinophagaceae bacterium]|nr:hypothetical protein [Chitinophagaceae bacterium]